MTAIEKSAELVGRILLAAVFIKAGVPKIAGYAGTQAYMVASGVPGWLLPAVIALEVLGGIAIVVGYRTRLVALALAAFSVVAALIFHRAADPMQQIMFMKNFAVAGGFLVLAAHGAGAWSLDARNAVLSAPGELKRRA